MRRQSERIVAVAVGADFALKTTIWIKAVNGDLAGADKIRTATSHNAADGDGF